MSLVIERRAGGHFYTIQEGTFILYGRKRALSDSSGGQTWRPPAQIAPSLTPIPDRKIRFHAGRSGGRDQMTGVKRVILPNSLNSL